MLRKYRYLSLLVAVMLVGALAFGCAPPAEPDEEPDVEEPEEEMFISIATGGTAGVYYPLGGAMASIIEDEVDYLSATSESTGASIANVELLAAGESEMALIQNDIAHYAFFAEEMYEEDDPVESLMGMATIYPEVQQVVAREDVEIETLADVAGMRVAVGDVGSGTEANARQILEAHGVTYDDIEPDYLSFDEAADGIRDGNVDVAFVTAGLPTAAVEELFFVADVNLVSLDDDAIATMLEEYPFYVEHTIEAGTYEGQEEDVVTTAVMARGCCQTLIWGQFSISPPLQAGLSRQQEKYFIRRIQITLGRWR